MAKKWVIADGPPLKVRLVQEKECSQDTEPVDKPTRARIVTRIVKMLIALWVLSVCAWLHTGDHSQTNAKADGPHDAIDGHDVFSGF
jgi:hypothetical protein